MSKIAADNHSDEFSNFCFLLNPKDLMEEFFKNLCYDMFTSTLRFSRGVLMRRPNGQMVFFHILLNAANLKNAK